MRSLALVVALTLTACKANSESDGSTFDRPAYPDAWQMRMPPAGVGRAGPTATAPQYAPQAPAALPNVRQLEVEAESIVPAMLIRTGEAEVEVRQLDSAVAAARRLVEGVGGFLGGTNVQGGRDATRSATLILKLPAARFDQAMTGVGTLGKVERQSSATEDVGEEYADLAARMANARRLEERLIDLLARRTGKLEEVLAVERELSRIREEIERMEGRSRFLRSRAAVSTLTLTLHEPRPIVGVAGRSPILTAFRDAWRNFVTFTAAFIASLGVIIPAGAVLAGALWLVRRLGWTRRAVRPPPAA